MTGFAPARAGPDAELRALARTLHDWRRSRDASFGDPKALLGEPAWDLLLDLYARGSGHHTSVLGGCIGAATPTTTALRRIGRLEAEGLLRRVPDDNDGRRSWLVLTAAGEAVMVDLLNDFHARLSNPRARHVAA